MMKHCAACNRNWSGKQTTKCGVCLGPLVPASGSGGNAELLPCPYCGGPAEVVEDKTSYSPSYRVQCADVMCVFGRVSWGLKETSIQYWNQRQQVDLTPSYRFPTIEDAVNAIHPTLRDAMCMDSFRDGWEAARQQNPQPSGDPSAAEDS